MGRSRKPLSAQVDQGFESLTFRLGHLTSSISGEYEKREQVATILRQIMRDENHLGWRKTTTMRKKKVLMPRIYKPENGKPSTRWHVEFSVFDEIEDRMQRFRKTTGFSKCTTEAECWANAHKLKREYSKKLGNGWTPFDDRTKVIWEDDLVYQSDYKGKKPLYNTRKTVAYYSTLFLKTKLNTSPGSYKTYMSKLRKFRTWLEDNKLNQKDVSIISEEDAKRFMTKLNEKQKKSGKTNNEYLRLFKEFWGFINKDRKGINNIWSDLPRYKNDTKPQRPMRKNILELLKKEMHKDIKPKYKNQWASPKPQLWLAGQFMYYCFIRPGELRQMRIKNLDLFEGKAILYAEFTKTDKTRVVDIPEKFANLLITKYKLQNYPEDYFIFTRDGKPGKEMIGANYFNKHFAKVRENLGLPKDYKFYGFKHTGAVKALKSGANIKDIQHQMGHSSVQITDEYLKSMVGYESEFFKKKMPVI